MDLSLVLAQFKDDGLVCLVARRAFFDSPRLPERLAMLTMVKAFNNAMSKRYRVREYDQVEGLRILRALDLTSECGTHFAKIREQRSKMPTSSRGPVVGND